MQYLKIIKNILIGSLLQKLRIHHSVYRLPCTSEYLEELIADALDEAGYDNDWQPNRSHSVSVDMTINDGPSISVKSGIYDPKKRTLTFSGSRLGKHETLDKMVKHVLTNKADYYVCVAKADQDWSSIPDKNDTKTYYLFVFRSDDLPYDIDAWTEKDNGTYVLETIGMNASIRPSMSYQLWTTVDEFMIGSPTKIDIMGS